MDETIFKAYDIRGTYPDQINEATAERIAAAYARLLKPQAAALRSAQGDREQPRTVAVGRDVRLSGPSLHQAVMKGLTEAGVNVVDIGVVPTELMYFAVGSLHLDGGVQVSASHNPAEYNGLKLVKKEVEPLSSDNGLQEIKALALSPDDLTESSKGSVKKENLVDVYLDYLMKLVDLKNLGPLTVVANNNFGLSGPLAKRVSEKLGIPLTWVELNFAPDGSFPKGRPDPLVPENRAELSMEINKQSGTLGVAWDADGDRCYIVDEHGEFIEGCHLTALLAAHLLKKHPGEKIIYDPRNVWAVEETVAENGGVAVLNKAGHTFIKSRMRQEKALFAGEMSGHFYYRDFFNSDNGLLTFLTFLELLGQSGQKVSDLAAPLRAKYHVSGEINFRVSNVEEAMADVKNRFPEGKVDDVDGLSLDLGSWRLNLRASNTETLLRLNVEAKDADTCLTKTNLVTEILHYHRAK